MSGPGASVSIIEAIRDAISVPGTEVLILARGGGDAPSLLPWSTEEVCRAVAACPLPVVSAIGHEGDRPLCDEVADLRCGTPSLAATAVVPDRLALVAAIDARLAMADVAAAEILDAALRRLGTADPRFALDSGLERSSSRLLRVGQRLSDCHPARRIEACRHRLGAADFRRPIGEILGRASGRLSADRRHVEALSPQRTLERGYSVATGPGGGVIRVAGDLSVGDRIAVTPARGRIHAEVTHVEENRAK